MSRLADPKILMAIKDLPLAAKTTVDGFLSGLHTSNVKGAGMEFSQYRSYQAGDDLRRLDWKMFARSDRYYIRESDIETSISVRIILMQVHRCCMKTAALPKLNTPGTWQHRWPAWPGHRVIP